MKKHLIFILFQCFVTFLNGAEFYVASDGDNANAGDIDHPLKTLTYAINQINTGDVIFLREGIYKEVATITILADNNGAPNNKNKIYAYNNETVILDFSVMGENSSNRGLQLYGDYWHIKGIIIQDAGDNGLAIGGNHNIVENCIFRRNHDTGLQLSRMSSSLGEMADWPSYNLILNCESYDNSDSDHEDADGFAAKLTCGPGNIFRNCVSHHNIDDGWDLYTKTETGPIGVVTLIECIAHSNGALTDGSTSGNGDKNGFKLGGEDIGVNHIVRRCIAFNNGKHGFTYNRNLGSLEISNCTSYNNGQSNIYFDGGTSVFNNNISYATSSNDKIIGTDKGNNVWDNDDDPLFIISDNDFVSLVPGDNAHPYKSGFLQLKEGSQLIDKGDSIDGISFVGAAPDLGAFEYGGTIFEKQFILDYSIANNIGGSIKVNPLKTLYDSAEAVTLVAVPDKDYTFDGWTGDFSGTDTLINIVMDANKYLMATYSTDKVLLSVVSSGPGKISVDPQESLYTKGTIVTLTAIPDAECYFIGWSGDTITEESPLTIIIDEDMEITAMFQQQPEKEIIFQFESSEICSADGKKDTKHAGYYGTGFWDFTNAIGASVELSVDAKNDVNSDLSVRYAMGKDELRPMEIRVNGVTQIESIDFPFTGAFTTWDTVNFTLSLQKGNNRIEIISLESTGGSNFDQVRISSGEALISKGYCDDGAPEIPEYTITTSVVPSNGGSITITPEGNVFEEGTPITLEALAAEGYIFTGWSNGVEAYIWNFNIGDDMSIVANFEEITTGITESTIPAAPLSVMVYPNPVSEVSFLELSINSDSKSRISVVLIDMAGRKYPIFSGFVMAGSTTFPIKASSYMSGIYIVEVKSDNQIVRDMIKIN